MNFALHGLLLQAFLSVLNFRHGLLPPCSANEAIYLDFHNLPDTNFSCQGKVIGGYYADLETGCQMFHVCTIGQKDEIMDIRFLCLNGTIFDQETRVCERVDEVDCSKSEQFYNLNLELYGNNAVTFGLHESDDEDNPSESVENGQRTTSAHPTVGTTTTTTTRPSKPSTTTARVSYQHSTGYPQQQFRQGYHHQYILHNDDRNDNQATSYQLFSNQGVGGSTTVQEVVPPQSHQIRFSSTPNPQIIRNEPSTISPIFRVTSSTIQTLLERNPSNSALINPIYNNNHGIVSTTETYNLHNPRDTSEYRDSEHRKHGLTPLEAIQSTNKGKVSKLSISPVPSQEEQKDSQTSQQQRIPSNIIPTPASVETTIKSFYPTPRTSVKPTGTTTTATTSSSSSSSSSSSNGQIIQHIHVPPPIPVPQLKPHHITINLPPPDIQRIVQGPPSLSPSSQTLSQPQPPLLPSQSRVIVTAKASVSDETGRPLNTTQLVTIPLPTIPATYDDYKEGDESFDPFYRDVPKLRNHRRAVVLRKVEKILRGIRRRRRRSLMEELDVVSTSRKVTDLNSRSRDRLRTDDRNFERFKRRTSISSEVDRKIDESNEGGKKYSKKRDRTKSHVGIKNDRIYVDLGTDASRRMNLNSDEEEEDEEEEVEEEEKEEVERKNDQDEKISERIRKESYENVGNTRDTGIEVLDLNEYVDSENNSNVDERIESIAPINNNYTDKNDEDSFEVTFLTDGGNVNETLDVVGSPMVVSYNVHSNKSYNEENEERIIDIAVTETGIDEGIANGYTFTFDERETNEKQNNTNKVVKHSSNSTNSETSYVDKIAEREGKRLKGTTIYDDSNDKAINDKKDYLYDDDEEEEEDEVKNNSEGIDKNVSTSEETISSRMMEDLIAPTTEIVVDTSKIDNRTKKLHSRISVGRKVSTKGQNNDRKENDDGIDVIDYGVNPVDGRVSTNATTTTSHVDRNIDERTDDYDLDKSNVKDVKVIDSVIRYSSKFAKDVVTSNKEEDSGKKKTTNLNHLENLENLGKINDSDKHRSSNDREGLESFDEVKKNFDESNEENDETTVATYLENSEEKVNVDDEKKDDTYGEEFSMERYRNTNDVVSTRTIGKDKGFKKNNSREKISDDDDDGDDDESDRTKFKDNNYSSEVVVRNESERKKNVTDTDDNVEFQSHEERPANEDNTEDGGGDDGGNGGGVVSKDEDFPEYDYPTNQTDYNWDDIDDYKESDGTEEDSFAGSLESDDHERATLSYETVTNPLEEENSESVEREDSTTGVLKFIDELPRTNKTEIETEMDVVSVVPPIQDYVDDNYEPHYYKEQETPTNTENPFDEKIEKDVKVTSIEEKLSKNLDRINKDDIKMEKEESTGNDKEDTGEFEKFFENNLQVSSTILPISKTTIEPLTLSTLISSTMASTTLSMTSLPSTISSTTSLPSTTTTTTMIPTITVPTTTISTTTLPTTTTTRSVPNLFKPFSLRKNYNYIPPTTTPNPVIIKSRLPLFNPKPAKPPKSYNELVPKPVIRKITLPTRRPPPAVMVTSTMKQNEESSDVESTTTTTTTTRYVENLNVKQIIVSSSTDSTDSQSLNSNIENFTSYPTSSRSSSTLSTIPTDITDPSNVDTGNVVSDITETSTVMKDLTNDDIVDPSIVPTIVPTVITDREEYADENKRLKETTGMTTSPTTVYYRNDGLTIDTVNIDDPTSISTPSSNVVENLNPNKRVPSLEVVTTRRLKDDKSSFPISKIYGSFNCLDREMYRFYGDIRDCRLFHYCSPGFTSRQVLDFRFVCEEGTMFDEESQSCRHDVKSTNCPNRLW